MIVFEQNGQITPEGQKVIDYIESFRETLNNPAQFNKLSGMVQYYLVNVREGVLTPAQYLRDYPSSANAVLDLVKADEEKAAMAEAVEETSDKVGELTEALDTLKQELAQALARIQELEKPAAPAKKSKKVVKESDPGEEPEEPEAEPVEEE
jgi:seryl-tRNA synthetase